MRKHKGNLSRLTWEDVYYDGGLLDPKEQIFCEEEQRVIKVRRHPHDLGWGYYTYEQDIEDDELEWYMKMNQGKIKRVK